MVQHLLKAATLRRLGAIAIGITVLVLPAVAAKAPKIEPEIAPSLQMDGGRHLEFERGFRSEREVKPKRGFWNRLADIVAGAPEFHNLVRPYSVVTDSRDRIIVADPGAAGIHIFDFAQQKYKFIARNKDRDGLHAPQCVAVDSADNIYVTDSEAGKIFVFEPSGKFQRTIGSLKRGEGFFKRPTGIAVDSEAQRIYVTDTLRDKIFVLDMSGSVLKTIGGHGEKDGEFNYPTELRMHGDELLVVDAMNFRVQVLDRSGAFRYSIGQLGDDTGQMFRPKGVGIDSEDHIYVVEGALGTVQVFDSSGQLLYYFGQKGMRNGEFQLPVGLFIDKHDRIFVADSYNRRIQVFHYYGLAKQAQGDARGPGGKQ